MEIWVNVLLFLYGRLKLVREKDRVVVNNDLYN